MSNYIMHVLYIELYTLRTPEVPAPSNKMGSFSTMLNATSAPSRPPNCS